MKYVIGIDTGTTGVKAKIYDLSGAVLTQAYREYECSYPRAGWVDQNIHMLAEANDEAIAELMRLGTVSADDIVSISFSTQRALHLYLDAHGDVLRDGMGISWQDIRCEPQVDWMREQIGAERYYEITGLPPSTIWAAPEIRWVQENEPEVFSRTAKIITTQEYFLHRLGARDGWYQDYSNGSLFGLMNIQTFDWDDELLKRFGLSSALLPELVPSGVQVGVVDTDAARRTGLSEGTPLVTGAGDQQCAAVGAGVIDQGLAEVTMGTAGVSIAHLDQPQFDPRCRISCSASGVPGSQKWISEGLQAAAASSYRWFRDVIGYAGKQVEKLGGPSAYETLNELVATVPPGANGLVYLPYLAGSMAPNFDSYARGAFIGLTFSHSTANMARAVLEGVSYESRHILEAFEEMGVALHEVRLSGGSTRSQQWCQILTDIYARPTVVLEEGECAVLGSAILAAVGSGIFSDVQEAVTAMIRKHALYEPRQTNRTVYDEGFAVFQQAYSALADSGIYRRLTALQET